MSILGFIYEMIEVYFIKFILITESVKLVALATWKIIATAVVRTPS